MLFRGTHAVPNVFVTVLVVVGFAAAAQSDWEFSSPEELGMDFRKAMRTSRLLCP